MIGGGSHLNRFKEDIFRNDEIPFVLREIWVLKFIILYYPFSGIFFRLLQYEFGTFYYSLKMP